MSSEKFHEEQPLPDDDPIPDYPTQMMEMMEEETVKNDDKNWPESAEQKGDSPKKEKKGERQKNEKKEKKKEEKEEKKISWSEFPKKQEPVQVHASETSDDDEDTEGSEESDDSGFENNLEDMEEAPRKNFGLGPLLSLSLGSAVLGGSLGYGHARSAFNFTSSYFFLRLGSWLSRVLVEKVVKGGASAMASSVFQPNTIAAIIGAGLFTWGAVNLCNEKAEED